MRRMVAWRSDSSGGEQRRRARAGSRSDKAYGDDAQQQALCLGFCIARYEASLRRLPCLDRTPYRRLSPLVTFWSGCEVFACTALPHRTRRAPKRRAAGLPASVRFKHVLNLSEARSARGGESHRAKTGLLPRDSS